MVKVKFTEDFATKLKGDVFECDSMLASHLVREDKVAVYVDVEETVEAKPKKTAKPKVEETKEVE